MHKDAVKKGRRFFSSTPQTCHSTGSQRSGESRRFFMLPGTVTLLHSKSMKGSNGTGPWAEGVPAFTEQCSVRGAALPPGVEQLKSTRPAACKKPLKSLTLVDEADRLHVNSLEAIRSIFDDRGTGTGLIATPGMGYYSRSRRPRHRRGHCA